MLKIRDILKRETIKNILTNLIYSILIIIYFITFNTQVISLEPNILIKYINISSLTFLGLAIIMFEIGYRKDKSKIFINGIEFFALAVFTLLIKQMPKILDCTIDEYIETGLYAFIAYYIAKSGIQYTIKKYKELKALSDIKEIVKEQPTKKKTKRKNIKIEEGK